jgi:hypothetical protein
VIATLKAGKAWLRTSYSGPGCASVPICGVPPSSTREQVEQRLPYVLIFRLGCAAQVHLDVLQADQREGKAMDATY